MAELDTREQAMTNSLDRILVRAASAGTTGAGAGSGAVPRADGAMSATPAPGPGGPWSWLAGASLVVGGGLLAFAVATNGSDESTASAPPATADVTGTVVSPTGGPADPQPLPIDVNDGSVVEDTSVATTDTDTDTGGDDGGEDGGTPVLIPTESRPVDVTEPSRTSTTAAPAGTVVGGAPVPTSPVPTSPGTTSPNATSPPTTSQAPSPPTSTCGSAAGLPSGTVTIDASVDFDGDGEPDPAGFYNSAGGALIIIDRSTAGLSEVGALGQKPVGDLSSGATLRAVLPEGSEAQIGLVIDDLDNDGETVWVRPVALVGCMPVVLEIPEEPELPGGDSWNGVGFSDGELDYGLQCLVEGDITVLTFRSFSDVPALIGFDAGAGVFDIEVGGDAANPGCWT